MDARTKQLISDPPLPLLVSMATPNSIAFFIQACVSMAEVWFIGQLGIAPLAAIALVFPLLMLTQTLSGGAMGGAVSAAIARALGASDQARAEKLIWHALLLAAACALGLLLLYAIAGRWLLTLLGGQGEALERAITYCNVLFVGGLALWFMGTLSAVFRGMGNMKFPAGLMIFSAAIQVPLSGVLILGMFNLPSLGVVGAAVSAIVSGTVISLIMLFRLKLGSDALNLRWDRLRIERIQFDDILRVFRPASLSPIFSVATILSLTAVVGRFGEQALAGYGIGSRIEFLMIPLVFGLGASMTSLVGMSIGAKDIARAEQVGWTGGITAAGLAGTVGIILALTPNLWIPLFTVDPEVHRAAASYIRIVGPAYAFFGLGLSLYFASQGAGAMRWPIAATIIRFIVAVAGALVLAFSFEFGLQGVYTAAAAAMVAYGLIIAWSLKQGAWRHS